MNLEPFELISKFGMATSELRHFGRLIFLARREIRHMPVKDRNLLDQSFTRTNPVMNFPPQKRQFIFQGHLLIFDLVQLSSHVPVFGQLGFRFNFHAAQALISLGEQLLRSCRVILQA